jgi:hypothetical protein
LVPPSFEEKNPKNPLSQKGGKTWVLSLLAILFHYLLEFMFSSYVHLKFLPTLISHSINGEVWNSKNANLVLKLGLIMFVL